MKKIFYISLCSLLLASCVSEEEKELNKNLEAAKVEIDSIKNEFKKIDSIFVLKQNELTLKQKQVETMDLKIQELDSCILVLRKELNPSSKSNNSSRVIVWGNKRKANQEILNDSRFKLK